MELGLRGKTAIVTGGSLGIGRAIARELAQEGVSVAIIARDPTRLQAAAAEISRETNTPCSAIPADLTDATQLEAAMAAAQKALGQVDILVNNAGATPMGRIGDTADEIWLKSINLKLMGYMRCARILTPAMRARKWGRVINISSVNGQKGAFGQTNYSAAKAGMHGFSKALALEVARKGVTVNTISPGYIGTKMVTAIPQDVLDSKIIPQIPMGRLGKPEEVAGLVAYLASDEAAFLTGANIAINGGQHMQ
jgi:acetoacetyl-CoA reductase